MYEDFIGNFPEDLASPLEAEKQGNREAGVSADHYSQANMYLAKHKHFIAGGY